MTEDADRAVQEHISSLVGSDDAMVDSLSKVWNSLKDFTESRDVPTYPITSEIMLAFAWKIFTDGVEWDAANKQKLLDMLDKLREIANRPYLDQVKAAREPRCVYKLAKYPASRGILTATLARPSM